MAVFKCKMCGGDLDVREGMTVIECEFCGTKQTIPTADDEQKTNLFNRANHLRRNNEFDRAIGVYENIITSFPRESEAYWGLLLCKFGIEYVDDPLTNKKIPTCHRASYQSILNDENYKKALEYADPVARSVYENEAAYIDNVQKDILKIANNEKPYDVFICYKETDETGNRTYDSVYAQDLYDHLTEKGMKVFFARITLEDKLGTAYEPYIFAALNSAKVMVVLGTKLEYFNAVWVKNEWMRFLELIKRDKNKTLIPVYKDIDPYDLPEAMAMLQAQDMSKIGFMQDLVRGIQKVVGRNEKPVVQTVVQQSAPTSANVENLLKRGMLSLEDGKWDEANRFFEDVLNENVEEARAYFGKLMADLHYRTEKDFETGVIEFVENVNYNKIQRFGDENIREKTLTYAKQALYNKSIRLIPLANDPVKFGELKQNFAKISDFKDSEQKMEECNNKANELIYNNANSILKNADEQSKSLQQYDDTVRKYNHALKLFNSIKDYRDLSEKTKYCKAQLDDLKTRKNKYIVRKKLLNTIVIGTSIAVILGMILVDRFDKAIIPYIKYEKAGKLADSRDYEGAIALYTELGDYKNSQDKISEIKYNNANALAENGDYENAIAIYTELDNYKDSTSKLSEARKLYTIQNIQNFTVGDSLWFGEYDGAIEWQVREKRDDGMLVISKNILAEKAYNDVYTDVTWETCSLRRWLNNDFYNYAFNDEEKAKIADTQLTNPNNPSYGTAGGNNTTDKLFLLSIDEAKKYFTGIEARNLGAWWWLRSPGNRSNDAALVSPSGAVSDNGSNVDSEDGVRPALNLKF